MSTRWIPNAPTDLMTEVDEEFEFQFSESWAVYADFLLEHGNPLGEQIARAQSQYLLNPGADEPELSDQLVAPVQLRGTRIRGFWRSLELDIASHSDLKILHDLLADESSRFIQELHIYIVGHISALIDMLVATQSRLAWMTQLRLQVVKLSTGQAKPLTADALSQALAKFPELVGLSLEGSQVVTAIMSETLRELSIGSDTIVDAQRMRLPTLRRLTIRVDPDVALPTPDEDEQVARQCSHAGMPNLSELVLVDGGNRGTDFPRVHLLKQIPRLGKLISLNLPGLANDTHLRQLSQWVVSLSGHERPKYVNVERGSLFHPKKQDLHNTPLTFHKATIENEGDLEFLVGGGCFIERVYVSRTVLGMVADRLAAHSPKEVGVIQSVLQSTKAETVISLEALWDALGSLKRQCPWLLQKHKSLSLLLDECRYHSHCRCGDDITVSIP